MKNILVPTDFSDCAQYASGLAQRLARESDGTIKYMNLISVPMDWLSLGDSKGSLYPEITERVNKVNHQLDNLLSEADNAGVKAQKFLGYNENFIKVVENLKEYGADFIVMGSHGATGLKEIFMGSNTQKVVRSSPVPVLVVKKPIEEKSQPSVVLASDFEDKIEAPFDQIVEFTKRIGGRLHLLFVNTPFNFTESPEIDERMDRYSKRYPEIQAGCYIYNCYNVEDGISQFCHQHDMDFLSLITHSRKGVSRVFSTSLTENISNHLDLPVLSVSLGY